MGISKVLRAGAGAVVTGLVVLSLGGCSWFGGGRSDVIKERTLAAETISKIGVNAYLWQASLQTLDFMPMASADAQGGVIITDWYVNPSDQSERGKVTVYILDKGLRADALKVNVFKQHLRGGQWVDDTDMVQASKDVADAILLQARRIRLSQVPGSN
ncbi:DUF3576 domain-containing protein [Govanella unica]|uniref:DUF3576 domain-containing protein n=1 Tax=Govanella unica TaxID=2975056 RepID=A0A9X3TVE2_9PROT|nr:DUF3576 domain-containing protein [Govania unica]MDA5192449.1 DUF3576 domain-containing protein [Govania unica]